ncbi:class I SAM-dependent methyltransferase [Marilutibacter chinensis]|uniref:Class I SAM-dependent methyltransferase n=1 Tax=Marilutibacter chinensis TaxID=2912247 RepID=A0ABS9HZH7_9GAMM|nr:class I SAM-dependent methyltransferase [Lysobacter chinensis]MCF7223770.1 class I SAM-dependent methyltransferase [Lysobacter chinensis]
MKQVLPNRSVRFFPHWKPDCTAQLTGLIQMVDFIFSANPKAAHWIEIGSYIGESSTVFLSFTKVRRLECVDVCGDAARILQKKFRKEIASSRCLIHNCSSELFATNVPDASIDVVYIDGDHSYEQVKNDILLYQPKLQPGGYLCGHDYSESWPGVVRAVDEFAAERNLDVRSFVDSSWVLVPHPER